MATGVIDQFELIKVEKHQRMPPVLTPQVLQHQIQSVLKFAAIGQSGQCIVGGLPGQISDVLPLLGHIMQHQHGAADFACTENRRANQRHGDGGAIHALDQLGVIAAIAQLPTQNMVDQLKTIIRRIFIQQPEQRRQGHALRLPGVPVGELFGSRVHVIDGTVHISGNHPVANRLQRHQRALFLHLQRLGKGPALRQDFMGAQQGQHNQHQGRGQVNDNQQLLNKARTFTQRVAEGFGGRGHAFVDLENPPLPALHVRIAGLVSTDFLVHFLRQVIELDQVIVTHRPLLDSGIQVTEMSKIAIEPNDARHIIRAVASLQDAFAGGIQIGGGLIQRQAQVVASLRHPDGLLVLIKNGLVPAVRVQVEVVNGIFLTLGPQAFARYIAPNCRKHIKAYAA